MAELSRVYMVQLTDYPEAGRVDIFEYSQAVAQTGVETHVIVCRQQPGLRLPPSLIVHELGLSTQPGLINSWRFARKAYDVIARSAATKQSTIIHLFNPAPATFILAVLLSRMPNRPKLIYDIRTGGLGYSPIAWLINTMARLAPWFVDGLIALSQPLADQLLGDKPRKPLAIIPLGVNLDAFSLSKHRRKRAPFICLYVGTLARNRELTKLLEAFALAHNKHPELELHIVGDGNDRPNLETWVKKHDLNNAITFHGSVPFTNIPRLMQTAHLGLVYVPMTPWFAGQPSLKLFEYLASGLPVVVTKTLANETAASGLPKPCLVGDNPEEFARGIDYAVAHYQEMEPQTLRQIAARYDWQTITQNQLLPFYNQLF